MTKKKIKAIGILLSLILLLCVTACRMQPILNIQEQPIQQVTAPGTVLTKEQIQNAILQACKDRGWNAKVISDGVIQGDISERRHYASVKITFTTEQYSINYFGSSNLQFSGIRINRHYNSWVRNLTKSIDSRLFNASVNTR